MKKMLCRIIALVLFSILLVPGVIAEADETTETEETIFSYRFATAEETARMLLENREYYENMNQNDLEFRMQKKGATLAELEAFIPEQALDFTEKEKAVIDDAMSAIEAICNERGYHLPLTDGIVFAKTTMAEECHSTAYTHGTEIYLGQNALDYGLSGSQDFIEYFQTIIAHELFHCMTRNHPDFRAAMYAILGFTVVEPDYEFAPEIRDRIISNPDVEHHNSYAAFEINGKTVNCVVIFTTKEPFRKEGDVFFGDNMLTGLVPVDDLSVMYPSDEASDFWDVFGRNTTYVIDPEETLADNFKMTMIYGMDGKFYSTPEIIHAMDEYLKEN